MGRFEDYPGLVGTGVQLLENRLRAISQGFESLSLRQKKQPGLSRLFLYTYIIAGAVMYLSIEFQEEYKRLDRLCKDYLASAEGVSEYIRQMESTSIHD